MALSLVLASRSASFSVRVVRPVYPKFKFLAWCCARILYRLINNLDYLDVFGYSLTSGLSDELLKPSSKMDPMLVSVDPVEYRRKMYYVEKKISGSIDEVADDNPLPLYEFLWFVVLGDFIRLYGR